MSRSVVVALPGIDPESVGVARVCPAELELKLGRPAFHVWSVLCYIRDGRHLAGNTQRMIRDVHPTVKGIGSHHRFEKTKPDLVKYALKRLRRAGLVVDLGWEERLVLRGRTPVKRKVYVRQVFGRIEVQKTVVHHYSDLDELEPDVALVPAETAAWMTTARSWGGRRRGAGRPETGLTPYGGKRVTSSPTPEEDVAKNQDYPPPKNQDYPPIVVSSLEGSTGYSPSENGAPPSHDGFTGNAPLGLVIGGQPAPAPLPSYSVTLPGVPPYPGWDVVAPARLPDPPLLKDDVSDVDAAKALVRIYRECTRKRYKTTPWALREKDVRQGKHYKTLVTAARALIEHRLPPAAWALFSFDVWKRFGMAKQLGLKKKRKGGHHPPVPWVFGANRIEERRGWFGREMQDYSGGALVFGEAHRDLLRRYELMRLDLYRNSGTDPSLIVSRYFPLDRSYEACVENARLEARMNRRQFEERIRRGELLWG